MKLHPATLIAAILGGALTRKPEPKLPPGEEWHNPDNLRPAEVGEGYRLLTKNEQAACDRHKNKVPTFHRWNADLMEWEGGQLGIDPARTYRASADLFFLGHNPARTHGAAPAPAPKVHNPGNVTPEQVGEGWRLLNEGEVIPEGYEYWYSPDQEWCNNGKFSGRTVPQVNWGTTVRVRVAEPADPYAALKAAYAAGKTIEVLQTPSGYWIVLPYEPRWTSRHGPAGYRIVEPAAPAKLPEGRQAKAPTPSLAGLVLLAALVELFQEDDE